MNPDIYLRAGYFLIPIGLSQKSYGNILAYDLSSVCFQLDET